MGADGLRAVAMAVAQDGGKDAMVQQRQRHLVQATTNITPCGHFVARLGQRSAFARNLGCDRKGGSSAFLVALLHSWTASQRRPASGACARLGRDQVELLCPPPPPLLRQSLRLCITGL